MVTGKGTYPHIIKTDRTINESPGLMQVLYRHPTKVLRDNKSVGKILSVVEELTPHHQG